jgi:hypothetical protein
MKTLLSFLPLIAFPMTALAGARLMGPLVDTIPPLSPPPAELPSIAALEIVETKTHDLGARKMIVQEVTAAALPFLADPPPPPPEKPRMPLSAEAKARIADARIEQRKRDRLTPCLSATVYHSKALGDQVRTLFTLTVPSEEDESGLNGEAIYFWSSLNANYLSQIPAFQGSDGTIYHGLRMGVSNVDLDQRTALYASRGLSFPTPNIPALAPGKESFLIVHGEAESGDIAVIQAVHDLYAVEHQNLKDAFEARNRAWRERDSYLKAHPEKPKDIVLRFRLIGEDEKEQLLVPAAPTQRP